MAVVLTGQLLHPDGKVTIKKSTYADSLDGTFSETPSTVGTRRAKIEPLSTEDRYEAMQLNEDVTHRVIVRRDSTTKTIEGKSHWFELGSRRFDIIGGPMDMGEEHRFIEFRVKERV